MPGPMMLLHLVTSDRDTALRVGPKLLREGLAEELEVLGAHVSLRPHAGGDLTVDQEVTMILRTSADRAAALVARARVLTPNGPRVQAFMVPVTMVPEPGEAEESWETPL